MNRDYLIKKGKDIKENGNMLGIKVTIPNQDETELIINSNSSIDNKIDYYCKAYDENLVHSMNDKIKIVDIQEIKHIIPKCSDELKVEELKSRGFREKMFMGMGAALYKEYKNDYHFYAIIVGFNGDVIVTNYDETENNTISFNFNMDFVNDLIYILEHLETIKD